MVLTREKTFNAGERKVNNCIIFVSLKRQKGVLYMNEMSNEFYVMCMLFLLGQSTAMNIGIKLLKDFEVKKGDDIRKARLIIKIIDGVQILICVLFVCYLIVKI